LAAAGFAAGVAASATERGRARPAHAAPRLDNHRRRLQALVVIDALRDREKTTGNIAS